MIDSFSCKTFLWKLYLNWNQMTGISSILFMQNTYILQTKIVSLSLTYHVDIETFGRKWLQSFKMLSKLQRLSSDISLPWGIMTRYWINILHALNTLLLVWLVVNHKWQTIHVHTIKHKIMTKYANTNEWCSLGEYATKLIYESKNT